MTLGQRLKAQRKQMKMTQKELADRLSKGESTISEWESDKRSPDVDLLGAIAAALGTTPAALVGWDDQATVIPFEQARETVGIVLPEDELELLELYRRAEPVFRQEAKEMLRRHPKQM